MSVVCNNEFDYTAQGKWQKKVCVRESTENLEMLSNTGKIQGIGCPYVINYPILKIKDIVIFAMKLSFFLRNRMCLKCQFTYTLLTNHRNWLNRKRIGKTKGIWKYN